MVLCSEDCQPLCDFCKYYKDNSIDNPDEECPDCYDGEGVCELTGDKVDCLDMCSNFHCFRVEEVK